MDKDTLEIEFSSVEERQKFEKIAKDLGRTSEDLALSLLNDFVATVTNRERRRQKLLNGG